MNNSKNNLPKELQLLDKVFKTFVSIIKPTINIYVLLPQIVKIKIINVKRSIEKDHSHILNIQFKSRNLSHPTNTKR